MAPSDAALLEKWAATRDADAFAEIVSRHSAMVYGTCKRILGNPADAEDAAQECFIDLAQSRAPVKRSLPGWLHTVATRRALNKLKAETRRKRREARFAAKAGRVSEPTWGDLRAYVDEAIDKLPQKLREPVVRRFLEGQTHEAIAHDLAIPRSTVQYRLEKGLEELRKSLKRRGLHVATSSLTAMVCANAADAAPASLTAELGKLAIAMSSAGPVSTAAATGAAAISHLGVMGGLAVMSKKTLIGLVALLLAAVFLFSMYLRLTKETPPAIDLASGTESGDSSPLDASPPEYSGAEDSAPEEIETPQSEPRTNAETAPAPDDAFEEDAKSGVDTDDKAGDSDAISGRVVDAQGHPVASARVVSAVVDTQETSSETMTDAAGEFILADLQEGAYNLAAVKKESGMGYVQDVSPGATDVVITLEPGGTISGQVYDQATGAGLEGIVVGAAEVNGEVHAMSAPLLGQLEQTTGPEGRYELAVTAQRPHVVSVHDAGAYIMPPPYPEEITLEQNDKIEGIDFALSRGGAIFGKVVDPDGGGVPGATVTLLRLSGQGFDYATCGTAGTFEFVGLPVGQTYTVVAHHHAHGASPGLRIDMPVGVDVTGVELELADGNTVYGQVVDANGSGLANVTVHLMRSYTDAGGYGMGYGSPATSDDGGFFEFAHVVPGDYITGVRTDWVQQISGVRFTMPEEGDYEGLLIPVKAKEEGFISGRVTDAAGKPVSGATVRAAAYEEHLWGHSITSADGAFTIEYLGGAEKCQVEALAPGYAEAKLGEVAVNTANLNIVLHKPGRIQGQIIERASGDPIMQFEVRIATYQHPLYGEIPYHNIWKQFTSETGEFVLAELPPNTYTIQARARGYSTATSAAIEVLPSQTTGDVVLRLDTGASITGTVTDRDGAPLEGIRVAPWEGNLSPYMLQHAGAGSYAMTDDAGRFRLDGLSPGDTVNLAAWGAGYATAAIVDLRLADESTDVSFTVGPEGRIEGFIQGHSQGSERISVAVRAVAPPLPLLLIAQAAADGHYAVSGLPTGTYDVMLVRMLGQRAQTCSAGSADVIEGQTTELHIQDGEDDHAE
ncbi:MAG TPA: sigma-70 family RNA polymerase sigma factor [Candidatus Hydrogenedentes bacterium]|nr:sigma-70 family RNA polymerase sigma factor [Candidatus Hydrogenedentota bacterium]